MAGGASTPDLVTAVGEEGGLGFLAAGYQSAEALAAQIDAVRALGDRPFGVNLFVPWAGLAVLSDAARAGRQERVHEYARVLAAAGHPVGIPDAQDDDRWAAKLDVLEQRECDLVSFTFGIPPAAVMRRLASRGTTIVLTVTSVAEARAAVEAGADALCVQGPDAGGHRGTHDPLAEPGTLPLAGLLAQLKSIDVPVIATGGIATPKQARSALAAGADAVQLGTLFLPTPESGAHPAHKAALTASGTCGTVVTRAFSGRSARGLDNAFIREWGPVAPAAYPEVNQLTQPLRAVAAKSGDGEHLALWAGTGHREAVARPAAEVVERVVGWVAS
jgi:nitronate monooxygenase